LAGEKHSGGVPVAPRFPGPFSVREGVANALGRVVNKSFNSQFAVVWSRAFGSAAHTPASRAVVA